MLILVYEECCTILDRTMNGNQRPKAPTHNGMMIQIQMLLYHLIILVPLVSTVLKLSVLHVELSLGIPT